VLQTHHNKSLAATIELSLASPLFQELGPDAQGLLGVVAFFPQGIDENNLEWLFPAISNRTSIFDNFCILSLTYRSDGFVTMLAPLRDHFYPKYPRSSSLLCATKEYYFGRLSVGVYPCKPGYEEARWIKSEDVNVEHLLDVFTTIDPDSDTVWDVCGYFMEHLHWHKTRPVTLGPKIRGLPDDHPSKPRCLLGLSQLFYLAGRFLECKNLLIHALELCRKRGDDFGVARTLRALSDVNRHHGLITIMEGIRQAEEASEIWNDSMIYSNKGTASDPLPGRASHMIDLLSGKGDQSLVCQCHRILCKIYLSKGKVEKAIDHFETTLEIASSFNWDDELITPWRGCFWAKAGSTTLMLTLNAPNCTWSTSRIALAAQRGCRPKFGIDNAG